MKNVKLGRQVLDHVVANPAEFNMATYAEKGHPCMTVACLAGHTLLFSGWTLDKWGHFHDPDDNRVLDLHLSEAAINLLGLTIKEYHGALDEPRLFSGSQKNSEAIERFRVIVEKAEAEAEGGRQWSEER